MLDAKPGEIKTVFIVQGIPAEEALKNIAGWMNSVQPSVHRVVVHNNTKSVDVKMAFVRHELHISITETEFKFFNEPAPSHMATRSLPIGEPNAKEEEPIAGKPEETKTEPEV